MTSEIHIKDTILKVIYIRIKILVQVVNNDKHKKEEEKEEMNNPTRVS